jgi:hypothetical protein
MQTRNHTIVLYNPVVLQKYPSQFIPQRRRKSMKKFLSNEILLGTLIALLSVFTAVASYQGALSDSEQNKAEIQGMQTLNNSNAEYITANQLVFQDFTYYDNWYWNQDTDPDFADYYYNDLSDSLQSAIERDGEWDDTYYEEMYAYANELLEESSAHFDLAGQYDDRGDNLQLVMLIMALGLAFAAWASLLKEESNMRALFAAFAIITLSAGLYVYFIIVPVVAAAG